jgi:hypothetical protein
MRYRMPEIGASGSVRGEGGNILTYSARFIFATSRLGEGG